MQTFARVLITGTSRGIGKSLAERYHALGWQVWGLARTQPDEQAGRALAVFRQVDVGNLDALLGEMDNLFEQGETAGPAGSDGNLDLVILNAGMLGEIADLSDTSLPDLKRLMDVNLWANKLILDAVFRRFQPKQVVAISSGASVNGNRGWGGYSLSKAALNMLIRLAAAENPDTHLVALAPGLVDTAMQEYLCSRQADDRFAAVETIKSKRHTTEMPLPDTAAVRLAEVISQLPERTPSGSFVDIRQLEF